MKEDKIVVALSNVIQENHNLTSIIKMLSNNFANKASSVSSCCQVYRNVDT
jgi:hypothetical protein